MAWDLDDDSWQQMMVVAERCARRFVRDRGEAQDVAMHAVERLLRAERRGYPLPGDLEAFTWVVTSRVAQDHLRARRRAQSRTQEASADVEPSDTPSRAPRQCFDALGSTVQQRLFDPPDPAADADPAARVVERASCTELVGTIRSILPASWWPVWERHLQGWSAPEIAASLSRSPGSVRMTVRRLLHERLQVDRTAVTDAA